MTQPPWSPNFDFYIAPVDGHPASISLDLGAVEHVPVPDHPLRLAVRLALKHARPDGLPTSEEFDPLGKVEQNLADAIGHEVEGWFVGRVLYRGSCDLFFYLPAPQEGDEDRLVACIEAHRDGYEVSHRLDRDPRWKFYNEFLWPDRASHQAMGNRRVLAQLEAAGDELGVEREIDHLANFDDEEACREAAAALAEHGFRLDEPTQSEHGGWRLAFRRDDSLARGRIDEVTAEILELIGEGDYDGWGCRVVTRE